MLNLTSSMAVAMRNLADSGFRPKGTLTYLAVADEEALGTWGAHHLVDHEWDAVRADYVITESGGIPIPSASGLKLPVMVGEKGCYWSTITVRGTPGHGSQPWRTDNALVKAAEVVRRIADYAPVTDINDVWRRFVAGIDLPEDLTRALLSPDDFMGALEGLPIGIARQFHACTHTTFSPNIVHGGSKINTIPDSVDLQVDIRTLPGQTAEDVEAQLREAIGDLADDVTFTASAYDAASASPIDTPLWDVLDAGERPLLRGQPDRADAHRRRDRRALLPAARRDGLRLRPLQPQPLVRGLLDDVPRRRRARRPGVVAPLDRAVAGRRPRPARLSQGTRRLSTIVSAADGVDTGHGEHVHAVAGRDVELLLGDATGRRRRSRCRRPTRDGRRSARPARSPTCAPACSSPSRSLSARILERAARPRGEQQVEVRDEPVLVVELRREGLPAIADDALDRRQRGRDLRFVVLEPVTGAVARTRRP